MLDVPSASRVILADDPFSLTIRSRRDPVGNARSTLAGDEVRETSGMTIAEGVKAVVICTLPRTGSSLLAAEMRSTGFLGDPGEYFNPNRYDQFASDWGAPVDDLGAFISNLRIKTASPNGVFGIKLMMRHLDVLTRKGLLPPSPFRLQTLGEYFGDALLIQLRRRDKLRQAISLTKATQTGAWGVLREPTGEPRYDRQALLMSLERIIKEEAMWERELEVSGMSPDVTVDYEDIAHSRDDVLLQIAHRLGLPEADDIVANRDRARVRLQRQSDAVTEDWYDRFVTG